MSRIYLTMSGRFDERWFSKTIYAAQGRVTRSIGDTALARSYHSARQQGCGAGYYLRLAMPDDLEVAGELVELIAIEAEQWLVSATAGTEREKTRSKRQPHHIDKRAAWEMIRRCRELIITLHALRVDECRSAATAA